MLSLFACAGEHGSHADTQSHGASGATERGHPNAVTIVLPIGSSLTNAEQREYASGFVLDPDQPYLVVTAAIASAIMNMPAQSEDTRISRFMMVYPGEGSPTYWIENLYRDSQHKPQFLKVAYHPSVPLAWRKDLNAIDLDPNVVNVAVIRLSTTPREQGAQGVRTLRFAQRLSRGSISANVFPSEEERTRSSLALAPRQLSISHFVDNGARMRSLQLVDVPAEVIQHAQWTSEDVDTVAAFAALPAMTFADQGALLMPPNGCGDPDQVAAMMVSAISDSIGGVGMLVLPEWTDFFARVGTALNSSQLAAIRDAQEQAQVYLNYDPALREAFVPLLKQADYTPIQRARPKFFLINYALRLDYESPGYQGVAPATWIETVTSTQHAGDSGWE